MRWLALLALFVAACSVSSAQTAYELHVIQTPDLTQASVPLSDATLDPDGDGQFYILTSPDTAGITSVDFSIDGGAYTHTEGVAPYVLGGNVGNVASAWDESLLTSPGQHTVTAVIHGPEVTVTVVLGAATPTPTPTSTPTGGPQPGDPAVMPYVAYGVTGASRLLTDNREGFELGIKVTSTIEASIGGVVCGSAVADDSGQWAIQIDPTNQCQPRECDVIVLTHNGQGVQDSLYFESGGPSDSGLAASGACGPIERWWSLDFGLPIVVVP